jgi:MFS family permease
MILQARTLFYGWFVLAAAMVLQALGGGIQSYGFSVFFLPLRESLGISAASASLIFALSRAEGAIEGPIAGYLIDRLGARVMLAVGAAIMAIGYVLLSLAQSFEAVLIIYLFVIAVGFNCGFGLATLALVNTWFARRRSFAMAIASAAPALGGAIVAPVLGVAVVLLGWRASAALAGVIVLVLILPVTLVVRRSPESMGLQPDGMAPTTTAADGSHVTYVEAVSYSAREAMRTPSYWFMLLATALRICVGGAMTVHFVAIMVWKGMDETVAAGLLGIFALFSVPLRIFTGWLGDRFSKTKLLALTLAVGTVSLTLLNYSPGIWYLWLFLPLFAWVESNPSLNWALIGDYFGRHQFATIRGSMSFFYGWAQMAAPLIAGIVWDQTGSYELALWIFTGMWVVGAIIFLFLRPPAAKPVLVEVEDTAVAAGIEPSAALPLEGTKS